MLTTIGMHALSLIGEFLIWRSILNSPNHQIKNLAKVSPLYSNSIQCVHLWTIQVVKEVKAIAGGKAPEKVTRNENPCVIL